MVVLPRFLKTTAFAAAVFLLSGCDSLPKTWSRDDLSDIAQDAAIDVSSAQQSKINDLEERVEYLESRVDDLESEVRNLGQ